jgi:hypothetical protein
MHYGLDGRAKSPMRALVVVLVACLANLRASPCHGLVRLELLDQMLPLTGQPHEDLEDRSC